MSGVGTPDRLERDEISLLVFRMMGVRIGLDSTQVDQIVECGPDAEADSKAHLLHEVLSPGEERVVYQSPKRVTPRAPTVKGSVIIDALEDTVTISIDAIRPLPDLLEHRRGASTPMWAVALYGGAPIFLVDLYKLLDAEESAS